VYLTPTGRADFLAYLKALEEVLRSAAAAMGTEETRPRRVLMETLRGAAKA
jgi:hypothetical protein